jgi:hypothetical protein
MAAEELTDANAERERRTPNTEHRTPKPVYA